MQMALFTAKPGDINYSINHPPCSATRPMPKNDDHTKNPAITLATRALSQPIATRLQWLEDNCATDPELLEQVQLLLEATIVSTQSAHAVEPTSTPATPPPECFGPYRLLDKIGAGGMGTVYRAERIDGTFSRTVAIKIVNGGLLSDLLLARFRNEREILAKMQHPNIARLFDGGSEHGMAYLVMEYVDGQPLQFNPNRTQKATLQLFLKICSAVQYAHGHLVLHRDIKPGNILVDSDGEPKLLDFGIAKIEQEPGGDLPTDLTQNNAIPLTVQYSAPERLIGKPASVATDVYSLGIVLYEILHGQRAYDLQGMTLIEAWQHLTRKRSRLIAPGNKDLEQIIAKATHSDPERRYASVAQLSQDIQNFLHQRPISARGDDPGYLLRCFYQRHKKTVLAGLSAIVILIGALITTTWAYLEAQNQATIAQQEKRTAEDSLTFISTLLSRTNPWQSDKADPNISDLLDDARKALQAGLLVDPAARGYVETLLSQVHEGRGDYQQAMEYARDSVQRLEAASIRGAHLAEAYRSYALALSNLEQSEAALKYAIRAEDELKSLDSADPIMLLTLRNLKGSLLEALGRESEAEQVYRAAIEFAIRQHLDAPNTLGSLHNNFGRLLHQQGRLDEAIKEYQLALTGC